LGSKKLAVKVSDIANALTKALSFITCLSLTNYISLSLFLPAGEVLNVIPQDRQNLSTW
jgi:hypothetical protein